MAKHEKANMAKHDTEIQRVISIYSRIDKILFALMQKGRRICSNARVSQDISFRLFEVSSDNNAFYFQPKPSGALSRHFAITRIVTQRSLQETENHIILKGLYRTCDIFSCFDVKVRTRCFSFVMFFFFLTVYQ